MEIKVIQAGPVAVLAPDGDLNRESAAEMRRALNDLLDGGRTKLTVDMGCVGYIDSSVWGELAAAAKRARDAGGELRVCAMGGDMLTIFAITRLSQLMAVYPTRERAIAS